MLATPLGCQFEVDRGPDWLLVKLEKFKKGSSGSAQLADCLWQLLEQNFTHRLVLDLNEIAAIDSSMMGELPRLYQRIREHDGVLRLCGLSPRNRRALQACSLADRLPAFGSREEAVMGGRDLCHPK